MLEWGEMFSRQRSCCSLAVCARAGGPMVVGMPPNTRAVATGADIARRPRPAAGGAVFERTAASRVPCPGCRARHLFLVRR
jgi:hypothetical protein